MFEGELIICVSSTGGPDTIYVGYATRSGDWLVLTQASMITRYTEVGVPGLSTQPEHAVRLRPVTWPKGRVRVPITSITGVVDADPAAWEDHLGVLRG